MCGIAGWVDYERDLTLERDVLQTMTATMKLRGPDDEGGWLAPRAGLGHRRLAIIDLEGGRQPMIADEGGAPVAVLIYTGEVYNFRELRGELEARGHRFKTHSDTEVVLRAYLEWGAGFPRRLNGMFAFALWDVRAEELLLVRDRLGIKPLFYQQIGSAVLFGSEPKAILANPLASPVVDVGGLRELLAFVKTPGAAVFRDMREVRPGHVVHVRRDGISERRYWALEARPHEDDLQATIRTVRGLLEDTVARQLISDVPLCSLLSGGLDSSAVTALAQRALRAEGAGPVRSFSVEFAGHAEHFTPDALRSTQDTPYVAEVARHVGSDHAGIVLSAAQLADPEVRAAVLRARDVPIAFGDMDASLYLLFRAIRERSTVALSGESADEVFGGYLWFHDPETVAAETFPWIAMRRKIRGASAASQLLAPALLAQIDLPGYVAARYREALAEVPPLPGEDGAERRMREISYLHLTRFLPILLDRKDRMSMATGLEVRVPFCDHRLVEYVFNAPWSMKTFDGREKSLLRAASEDLLPRSVLDRRKSPYPSTQDPAYSERLRGQLAGLLARKDAPVLPLLDMARARAVASESGGAVDEILRSSMHQVLLLNDWLTRYRIDLAL
ncbi:asparagine synthase (glutamine-hydrolyzing) [Sorangium atrum]|uniref:asparagine synthase (glutamine-hydrolyzing) n=1 Tax=Sorangium atrum TaxID=2995308 RepID=A0ABT5BSC6_9BACT|nr:asparagine synthase (glutamine-hydrolyzing) [Sorangium aterium]MDC0677071.1 asparagine synthase (glutamine-hydrolyzing) [Sorangium aterium]